MKPHRALHRGGLTSLVRRVRGSGRARDAALKMTRVIPGLRARRVRGEAAFRLGRWRVAEQEFDALLARTADRRALLMAASVQERLHDNRRRDALISEAERRFPSDRYDSGAVFASSGARPYERDLAATWLAANSARLRRQAGVLLRPRTAKQYAFVYWDDIEQPDVVQHCIDSARQWLPPDLELVELHSGNLAEWITIDPRIMDKVDIPAHGADMIRLHLLSTHGGMWLDASCLLNPSFRSFSDPIRSEDFFLFTYAGARTGNWFIWGQPDSFRLQLLRAALDTWFLDGHGWTNYFQFHDFVEMLYWIDARYREEWDAGLHIHPRRFFDCHKALGQAVSDEDWARVRGAQPINKLSWRKYNAPALRENASTGVARLMAEPLSGRSITSRS